MKGKLKGSFKGFFNKKENITEMEKLLWER